MTNRELSNREPLDPEDDKLTVEALKLVVKELTGKIQFLVDWAEAKGLLEDHTFTFPDGDIWKAAD